MLDACEITDAAWRAGLRPEPQMLVSEWAEAELNDENNTDSLHERMLALVEPPLLEEVLRGSGGQYSLAARKLGLHRTTLRKKLDQYGIKSQE